MASLMSAAKTRQDTQAPSGAPSGAHVSTRLTARGVTAMQAAGRHRHHHGRSCQPHGECVQVHDCVRKRICDRPDPPSLTFTTILQSLCLHASVPARAAGCSQVKLPYGVRAVGASSHSDEHVPVLQQHAWSHAITRAWLHCAAMS